MSEMDYSRNSPDSFGRSFQFLRAMLLEAGIEGEGPGVTAPRQREIMRGADYPDSYSGGGYFDTVNGALTQDENGLRYVTDAGFDWLQRMQQRLAA